MSYKLVVLILFFTSTLFSQENEETSSFIDVNYFTGTIARHNKDISHLVKNHPDGLIVGYNFKTFGKKRWQQAYNYPDWGVSFVYHNPHNSILGENYGVFGHYNFYLLKRHLFFRVGSGITYNTNPFDLDENFKNNAYGSSLMSSTYLMLNYNKKHIYKGFGLQGGISLLHYSNGNIKAPNSSTNSLTVNIGVQYDFSEEKEQTFITSSFDRFTEPITFNFVIRGGLNESDYIGLGQQPFAVVSAYADKRISFLSTLQFGAEAFFSKFLQKQAEYTAAAFPTSGITGDEDYKRVGVFVGHELHIHKFAIVSQLGYYVYYPYEFEGRVYLRAGMNYYFTKHIFGAVTLKSHGAKAEAIEFGVGYRI